MSLPYALIEVIVGEFLVASSGLGYRLNFCSTSYNTNGTFTMLLVMMVLMMALNSMMALLERDGTAGALCLAVATGNNDHDPNLLKLWIIHAGAPRTRVA